jgi:hypothetical protein
MKKSPAVNEERWIDMNTEDCLQLKIVVFPFDEVNLHIQFPHLLPLFVPQQSDGKLFL